MRRAVVLLLLLGACGRTRDAERAGDESYGAGRYAAAAAQYRRAAAARGEPRVLAKLGQASYRAAEYVAAADAWRRLGQEDPSRREEAADGLEMVVRGAERERDEPAVREALAALAALAPERRAAGEAPVADDPIVAAMAQADGQRAMDSLLVAWADRAQDAGDCDVAVGGFRAAVRRGEPGFVTMGRIGVARCATTLGRRALEEGRAGEAAAWYREALAADPVAAGDAALAGLARASAAEQETIGGAAAEEPGATPADAPDGAKTKE